MNHWSMCRGISLLPGHVTCAENSERIAFAPRMKRTVSSTRSLLMRVPKTLPLLGRKATHWLTSSCGSTERFVVP